MGNYNYGVVSCDWLAFSCMLTKERDLLSFKGTGGWSCIEMGRTSVWGERWFVLNEEGDKIATVLMCPLSPIIDARRCLVEIANRFLYVEDIWVYADRVFDIFSVTITGLSRIDLCCDFEMTAGLYEVYCDLYKGDAYLKGLRRGGCWWQQLCGEAALGAGFGTRVCHCQTFGGKESSFKWKVYWKWLELEQGGGEGDKPYIRNLWRNMEFDERKVWRVEVSVSDAHTMVDPNGQRICTRQWVDDRVKLFRCLYVDKFVIRANEGHIDRRNDKVLTFLDMNGMKYVKHGVSEGDLACGDVEKRVVCKLWKELNEVDVQCSVELHGGIRGLVLALLEKPSNVEALKRRFGVTMEQIVEALK